MTTVKITELANIGPDLASSSLVPVVNMAGTPVTQKTNIGNIANLVLQGAGVDYAEATVALLAQTVSNAAQPNITSVGTLSNITVSGNASINGNITSNGTAYVGNLSTTGLASITTLNVGTTANLGSVNNIIIEGGTDGQVLTTDGDGNLSWTSGATTYSNSNVVTLLSAFGSNTITTTGNISGGNVLTSSNVIANGAIESGTGFTTGGYLSVDGNTDLHNTIVTGNLSATGNITANNLGNISAINLTGSNSNVLYGNGVFAPASGGGNANTGNVTFNDINIIGTGNLNLQPDPANSGSYLDIFLSSGPDLHLVASAAANLILGKDNQSNVMTSWDGNVYIQSWDNNTNTQGGVWTFGGDGTTTFPTANIDLHNGGVQSGEVLQFGNPNLQSIITGPTPADNNNAQRIIIQGQRGTGTGEGGDVYVWGGDSNVNGGDIKIYAGDAEVSGYGGYINIDGGTGIDGGGGLSLTGGQSANGQGGQITITPGYSGNSNGATLSLNGGQAAGNGGGVNITAGAGTANGGQVTITGGQSALGLPGYGNVVVSAGASQWKFDNTGNLVLPSNTFAVNYANGTQAQFSQISNGNSNVSVPTSSNNVYINVNGGSSRQWIFDTVGNLRTPGNVDIYGAINFPQQVSSLNWSTYNIELSQYGRITTNVDFFANANTIGALYLKGDGSNITNINTPTIANGTSNINIPTSNGNVAINVGSNSWVFSTTGDVQLPGNSYLLTSGEVGFSVAANSVFEVTTTNSSNNYTWQFNPDGSLLVPEQNPSSASIISRAVNSNTTTSFIAFATSNVANLVVGTNGNNHVVINTDKANANIRWIFDNLGNLTLPGNTFAVNYANGTQVSIGGGANTGNVTFNDINIIGTGNLKLQPVSANSESLDIYLTAADDIHIAGSGNIILGTDEQANVAVLTNGNVAIQAGNVSGKQTWNFGTDGNLTLPGNLVIAGNANVFGTNSSLLQTTDNRPLIALSSGANGAVSSLWVEDIGNVGTSNIAAVYANPTVGSKIVRIAVGQNGGNAGPNLWDFNANGTTTFPGDLIGNGASPAPSINNFNSISSLTLSASGNITGGNIIGNGNTLSNVATKTSGSWTLASGVNTVSINVPLNGTYAIWVNGNIPNGIITYTATAVVTNTNVPVLGEQYGWYYEAGNALVLTSIPNQFVGTQGAISNAAPYSGNTANVFTFSITNNSGNTAVVNYGYTKL